MTSLITRKLMKYRPVCHFADDKSDVFDFGHSRTFWTYRFVFTRGFIVEDFYSVNEVIVPYDAYLFLKVHCN